MLWYRIYILDEDDLATYKNTDRLLRHYRVVDDPDALNDDDYKEAIDELDYIIEHKQTLMIGALRQFGFDSGLLKKD